MIRAGSCFFWGRGFHFPGALAASAPVGATHVAAVPGTPAVCVEAAAFPPDPPPLPLPAARGVLFLLEQANPGAEAEAAAQP
jgi:hypothetical protein